MRKHYVDQGLLDFIRFYCDLMDAPVLPTMEGVLIGRTDTTDMAEDILQSMADKIKKYEELSGLKADEIFEFIKNKM